MREGCWFPDRPHKPIYVGSIPTPVTMAKDPSLAVYTNKKGEFVDIATGLVVKTNIDGSPSKRGLHLTPEIRAKGAKKGLEAANDALFHSSPYTGDDNGIHWEKFFATLKKSPMLVSKAAVSAGFTMRGVKAYLGKNKALQERFDSIQEANLDEHEQNIYELANLPIVDESKSLPTILRANETMLNAHAKSRGFGVKQGINIEGSAVQININHDMLMPGEKDDKEVEQAEIVEKIK